MNGLKDRSRSSKTPARVTTTLRAALVSLLVVGPGGARAETVACDDLRSELVRIVARLDAQDQRLRDQESRLVTQDRRIAAQDSLLDSQAELIARQRRSLQGQPRARVSESALDELRGTGPNEAAEASAHTTGARSAPVGQVGLAPEDESAPAPDLSLLADQGGVLTPRGVLVVEPEVEFLTSSRSRFSVDAVGIENALAIGNFEASDSDRGAVSSRLQARLGVAQGLELSLDVPYVWRRLRFESQIPEVGDGGGQASTFSSNRQSGGIGDVAVGLHYQLPRSLSGRATWVANLRVKSDTGSSPFDVDRDEFGVESELSTGSGHWSLEPSLTWIAPTDPAVLYGTLAYAWNLATDVDELVRQDQQDVEIGRVDPSDAIGLGFGIGIALNETMSLSLGYSHRYLFGGEVETSGTDFRVLPTHLGELQIGLSFAAWDRPMRLTTAIGVTEASPDVRIGLSTPMSFTLFE